MSPANQYLRTLLRWQGIFPALMLVGTLLVMPAAAQLRVVATVKPVHSLVTAVADGTATTYLVVKGAASPHSYALKPSDAAALQHAEIIFRISDRFETFLNTAIAQVRKKALVIDLIRAKGLKTLPARSGARWAATHHHGSEAGHGRENGHGHGSDRREHAQPLDQHIWLSPRNAEAIVRTIETTLASRMPSRRADLKRNADSVIARIHQLAADIQTELAPARGRPYLVYHDAFQYFERAFDLPAHGSIALGDARSPGAKRVRDLRKSITADKIVCVFTEPQFVPRLAEAIIAGTTARIATLDPVGARLAPGPDAYFELMRSTAKSLAGCLKR